MSLLESSSFEQLLSSTQLDQLQTVLEQVAQSVNAQILTETAVSQSANSAANSAANLERFVVVVSQPFSALMRGQALQSGQVYQTVLSFSPETIRLFIKQLLDRSPDAALTAFSQLPISPANDPTVQSHFTLKLVSLLGATHCESTEMALRQQIEQERLLNQVATQIRQSLELPVILKTAVEQVRQFLQSDRPHGSWDI